MLISIIVFQYMIVYFFRVTSLQDFLYLIFLLNQGYEGWQVEYGTIRIKFPAGCTINNYGILFSRNCQLDKLKVIDQIECLLYKSLLHIYFRSPP